MSQLSPIRYSKLNIIGSKLPTNFKQNPVVVKTENQTVPRMGFFERLHSHILTTLIILSSMVGVFLISHLVLIHKSLRLDESQSLWQASHSVPGLLHAVALDVHVPLYHMILHFWIFYFGDGVATVRTLSLIFFLASIPVIYLIARQVLSRNWARFAVVLFSFSPFMNWYANEARMYTLLVLMASLNIYFFMRIMRNNTGWFWFAVTSVVGAYSHYFFMFVLATEALFFLATYKQFARRSFAKLMSIGVLVLAGLSPWLYYFHKLGSASGTRPRLVRPSTVDFSNVYSQFLFGFQNNHINTILLSSWPVLMIIALLAVRRNQKIDRQMSFIITLATLPIILAYLISLVITPFFLSRYMVASVAPLIIVILWFVSKYTKRAAATVAVLLIIGTTLSSYQQATSATTPVKEDYQAAAQYISAQAKPQDLVVLSAPFTVYPFEYYYHGSAEIHTLPEWDRTAPGQIPAFNKDKLPVEVAAQNKNHRYIYLLLSQDQGYEKTIDQYYLSHFKQISNKKYSDDLTLYVYQVGFYTVPPLQTATFEVQQ